MKITVIGTGHVGLVVGLCFAEIGHEVVCVDNDPHKIKTLEDGQLPFYEPELETLLSRATDSGRIRFVTDLAAGVEHSELIFFCLGTPPLPGGEADLSSVERVARQIARLSDSYKLVVEKSTVPVLTGERIRKTMQIYSREKGDVEFDVASNPEFLAEGSAVVDFLYPDRIVIGVENGRAEALLREAYAPIVDQTFEWRLEHPVPADRGKSVMLVTNRNSAELIKHASNSFLAMKISYINAISNLCDAVGADVRRVAEGMGYDHRIGPEFLKAGIGFGGFCFPKDLEAFIHIAEKNGQDFGLLREVERVNTNQIDKFIEKVRHEVWVLKGKTIAVWGLAFKPNTDDLRFSPSLITIERLLAEGAAVRAYDPQAMPEARQTHEQVTYAESALDAAAGADALLLLTGWSEFRDVDLAELHARMVRPLILDGRNHLDPEAVRAAGFEYVGMGLPQNGEAKPPAAVPRG
ncbi:MAG: UDP-glucose/GDP-mannose dehydrogenase family protein [Acidobacteria bacterium]|nr:UDP-glucose/GDP-mannose dehydrogenase family protein [Acidobacteriota bacterium]